MTFNELNNKLGGQEKQADWRKASGGGWIYKTARVEQEDRIQENALVGGNVWVSGNARVSGDAWVLGNARVLGNAQVLGNARVSGDAWVKPVLFVVDSRGHGATNCRHGWLRIGCEEHTFADWKMYFPRIARKHHLTEEEQKEYRAIVNLFCSLGI